ncbi:MAG: hypothetical protein M1833_003647 [Piccolia ochrophora]|nr:MAG: hypothetical protein M1833_003647 [Piccolia ochrophora]
MRQCQSLVSSSLSLPPDHFIYALAPTSAGLVALSSDDSLRIFDRKTLAVFPHGLVEAAHTGAKCLESFEDDAHLVVTAGSDGHVKLWDLRSTTVVTDFQLEADPPISALHCKLLKDGVCAGTELSRQQATVALWDIRSPRRQKVCYTDSHNDDITVLQFHPDPSSALLLSGSTDGLVNVYDTNMTDEDDALQQIMNHGSSVNLAEFVDGAFVCAVSHDEILSLHPLALPTEEHDSRAAVVLGDVREMLNCDYVIDLLPTASGRLIVAAGSHSQHHVDLIELTHTPHWRFDDIATTRLAGGHGDDIVRSVHIDEESETVHTAGEDGKVRSWKISGDGGEGGAIEQEKGASRRAVERRGKAERYHPY